jgi:hypothetical protein
VTSPSTSVRIRPVSPADPKRACQPLWSPGGFLARPGPAYEAPPGFVPGRADWRGHRLQPCSVRLSRSGRPMPSGGARPGRRFPGRPRIVGPRRPVLVGTMQSTGLSRCLLRVVGLACYRGIPPGAGAAWPGYWRLRVPGPGRPGGVPPGRVEPGSRKVNKQAHVGMDNMLGPRDLRGQASWTCRIRLLEYATRTRTQMKVLR